MTFNNRHQNKTFCLEPDLLNKKSYFWYPEYLEDSEDTGNIFSPADDAELSNELPANKLYELNDSIISNIAELKQTITNNSIVIEEEGTLLIHYLKVKDCKVAP